MSERRVRTRERKSLDSKGLFGLTRLEWRWVLYDVGNSAFTLVSAALFALFFQNLVDAQYTGADASTYGDSVYALATAIVTLGSVVLEPLFGSMSDYRGLKRPLFLFFSLGGVIGCIALGFEMQYVIWLVILCVTKILYNGALMIYDAMLVDVTTPERTDKVSSFGYAFGYIGSCIPFIAGVCIVAFGFTNWGLTADQIAAGEGGMSHSLTVPWGYLICFVMNAAWWLIFTIPLFTSYKQKVYIERQKGFWSTVADSYKRIGHTFGQVKKNAGILLFLIAFFFYIDSVYTIIDLAVKISGSLGVDQVQALIALIAVQIIAFPATLVFGYLSKHFRSDVLIGACIVGYLFITLFAVFLDRTWMFWLLAVFVGLFQGGIQSLSRSYLSQIIDPHESGEVFSLFDTFGKGASFLGTLLFSVINSATGDPNLALIPLPCMVAVGGVLFGISAKMNRPALIRSEEEAKARLAAEAAAAGDGAATSASDEGGTPVEIAGDNSADASSDTGDQSGDSGGE